MKIVIQAAPRVRTICPVDFIEGRWMDVPDGYTSVTAHTPPGPELEARPSGKWARNGFGESAPIWVLDYAE